MFWMTIGKFGMYQNRRSSIPFETFDEQNNVATDINKVLYWWKSDFADLFENNGSFDKDFLRKNKSKVV